MQANIPNIPTFDATKGTSIDFQWYGKAAKAIRCIIKDNTASATTVYDQTYRISDDTSGSNAVIYNYSYALPANALTNGNWYNAFIQVSEKGGDTINDWSDMQSTGTLFKTIATPTLQFLEFPSTMPTGNYVFTMRYSFNKDTSETMKSWVINIYDTSKSIIETTTTQYENMTANSGITTLERSFSASGFNNGVGYYIQGFAETETGMQVQTEMLSFNRETPEGDSFYILTVDNIACQGAIQCQSFVAIVDGEQPLDARYIYDDDNNAVMVSTRNNTLTYKDGFKLTGDFTISLIAADIDQGEEVMEITNSIFDHDTSRYSTPDVVIDLSYLIGYFGTPEKQGMFALEVTDRGIKTVYFSNKLPATVPEDLIQVTITRKQIKTKGVLTNGWMWNLGARVVDNSDIIHAKHSELNAITHKALSKYTHRQITLGYPLDYER